MVVDFAQEQYRGLTEAEATHKFASNITDETFARSRLKREIRKYEVSLWTLQDDFITVLKWSDAEHQGRIQDPQMELNIDGTQNFKFSIPMYIEQYIEGQRIVIENPSWHSVQDGNLIEGMRKIKVIFNYGTTDDDIFEFLITNVSEEHEEDKLFCRVECEGLAFHELGKIGYKYELSDEGFELTYKTWCTSNPKKWTRNDGVVMTSEPKQNVQYWCDQCNLSPLPSNSSQIDPTRWYYQIRMNWDLQRDGNRSSGIIYEEPYPTSWSVDLSPEGYSSLREKCRPVNTSESNIYNITQTIAEAFQVYCKYEYKHDSNHHIIGRTVVFYNNFFRNQEDAFSINYPYDSKSMIRNIDSSAITTKMYVVPQDDDTLLDGQITIANTNANPTKEDYLLNFDYMHDMGAITDEQYAEIDSYSAAMARYNNLINQKSLELNYYQQQIIDLEAKLAITTTAYNLDDEQIETTSRLFKKLDESDGTPDGYFEKGSANPYSTYVKQSDVTGQYYIDFNNQDKGILDTSLHIYRAYNSATRVLSNEISSGIEMHRDQYGDIDKVFFSSNPITGQSKIVYAVYKYQPKLYYTQVRQFWEEKLKTDKEEKARIISILGEKDYDKTSSEAKVTSARTALQGAFSHATQAGTIELDGDYRVWSLDALGKMSTIKPVYATESGGGRTVIVSSILPNGIELPYLTAYNYAKKYLNSTITLNTELSEAVNYSFRDIFMGLYPTSTWGTSAVAAYQNYFEAVRQLRGTGGYYLIADTLTEELNSLISEKNQAVIEFERFMGPALREGYWQPEKYNDYGDAYQETKEFLDTTAESQLLDDSHNSYYTGWDIKLFDQEEDIYYQESVALEKKYYPCIDISNLIDFIAPTLDTNSLSNISFAFSNNYSRDLTEAEKNSIENIGHFTLNGNAKLGFIRLPDETIKPVMILTGAQNMTDDEIAFMLDTRENKGQPRIGILNVERGSDGTTSTNLIGPSSTNYTPYYLSTSEIYWYPSKMDSNLQESIQNIESQFCAYPRIKFSSSRLKTHDTSLIIKLGTTLLTKYEDYYILTRATERSDPDGAMRAYVEYYITLQPKVMVKNWATNPKNITVNYTLSTAATNIYVDAVEIMEENSKPKVSYEVTMNILNKTLMCNAYKMLTQLLKINDVQLKFKDVWGYVSKVELDLDQPQNDKVEIKNYTSKFEDLFSTIVAQTEEMKKNSGAIASVLEGNIGVSDDSFNTMVSKNYNILEEYLDIYFDSSKVVVDRLTEIFGEAGEALASANQALNNVGKLTLKNANILAGFVENIQGSLTPTVYNSKTKPESFKTGDIWNQIDDNGKVIGAYVAISGTDGGSEGFARTYDGTLASIKGANMSYDAVAGTVDIYGEHNIDLRSGEHVYIAAGDSVDVVGNRAVNIGGATINIVANNTSNLEGGYVTGGINIVSASAVGTNLVDFTQSDSNIESNIANAVSSDSDSISKVLIHPNKIELGSADIIMKGANVIQLITSRNTSTSTSAMELSPENGIWIGSGKGLHLFSGGFSYDASTNTLTKNAATGASVDLDDKHLILGYAEVNKTSGTIGNAIEMTKDYMILASGSPLSGNSNTDGNLEVSGLIPTNSNNSLVGAKLTKSSIAFATQDSSTINAIIMNDKGVSIASGDGGIDLSRATSDALRSYFGPGQSHGSYIRVGAEGIELGSLADLYVNTTNFKLQTHSRDKGSNNSFTDGRTVFAIGNNLQYVDAESGYDAANNRIAKKNGNGSFTAYSANPEVDLLVNKNGLYVNGTVYASAGSFTGAIHASSFELTGTAVSDFNTAVGATTTISGINTAIGNTTKSTILIYYLTTSTTAPSAPNAEVTTASTTSLNTWALSYPEYPVNNSTAYYYYSCIQSKSENGTVTWSTPTRDYGVTSAARAASLAKITNDTFTTNGLLANYSWGGKIWPVALTSTSNMLIGANTGLYFVKPSASSTTNGAALVIDDSGIAMTGSTISLNADSTISITSGATININSSNLTIKSSPSPASGENYFYVGESGTSPTKYIKYTSSGILEVKGSIVATSFSLSGNTATNAFKTAVNDAINGVGWKQWPADSGNYYVSLTSSADNQDVKGILIGVSESQNVTQHLIVPYSASSSKKMVDISKNGIYFDTNTEEGWISDQARSTYAGSWELQSNGGYKYKLSSNNSYYTGGWLYNGSHWYYMGTDGYMYTGIHTINNSKYYFNTSGAYESNHIYLDNSGINVVGNRININGKDVWARDDIIVLTPAQAASPTDISNIESSMAQVQQSGIIDDWIMIVPSYNAKLNFSQKEQSGSYGWTPVSDHYITMAQSLEMNYFITPADTNNDYFDYTIEFSLIIPSSTTSNGQAGFICSLGCVGTDDTWINFKSSSKMTYSKSGGGVDQADNTDYPNDSSYTRLVTRYTGGSYTDSSHVVTYTLNITSPINVCKKDHLLQFWISQVLPASDNHLYIKSVTIEAKLKTANSRVPCAIYYYPAP